MVMRNIEVISDKYYGFKSNGRLKNKGFKLGLNNKNEADNIGEIFSALLDNILDPTACMSEIDKQEFVDKLYWKIYSGKKLVNDEMMYLRAADPIQYNNMIKVQMQRHALEEKLKRCKDKEHGDDLYIESVLKVSMEDSTREETLAAYKEVYSVYCKNFKKTLEWNN